MKIVQPLIPTKDTGQVHADRRERKVDAASRRFCIASDFYSWY